MSKGEKANKFKATRRGEKNKYKISILEKIGDQYELSNPRNSVLLYHLRVLQILDTAIQEDSLEVYHLALLRQVLENIASFLGIYSKELEEFASKTNLPCLKTSLNNLFASEKDFREELLPSNIQENAYLYLENHDNAPIREVLKSTSAEIKNLAYDRLRSEGKKLNVPFDSNASSIELAHFLIELAFASKAEYVTLTFQDMIFSGKESRMNTPGIDSTLNWSYRFLDFEFSKRVVSYFKQLNSKYNRHK